MLLDGTASGGRRKRAIRVGVKNLEGRLGKIEKKTGKEWGDSVGAGRGPAKVEQ